MIISSKPYQRKKNLVSDKALNSCWEIQFRFNSYDLFVSILRRSYIPPLIDMYQDIIIFSKFLFDTTKIDVEEKKKPATVKEW
jgi:hypothetical protein